jgi:hypothetical protein
MSGAGEAGGAGAPAPADAGRPAGAGAGAAGEAGDAIDPRVAEVLQQLRSGVRQRQAEAATVGGLPGSLEAAGPAAGGAGFAQGLLAVKAAEYVQEPVPLSHRPRLGKLIVGSRKAFFHLLLRWFLRPVLAQQNAFNQAAGRMLQDLAEAQERTAREVRVLAALVAELEARGEGAGAGTGARAEAVEARAATAAAPGGPAPAGPSAPVPADPSAPAPGAGEPRR